MKNLQSNIEGTWVELIPFNLTSEQDSLLSSTKQDDSVAKEALIKNIQENSKKPAQESDVVLVMPIYLSNKPELKDTDVYELISVDTLIISPIEVRGIINCRVNGEHIQVRF